MMKKNLKKAVSLALASVMAFSLAACSGGSGSGTTTAAQADGKEAGSGTGDVTIKFCWWGGDSRHEATEKAVDAFMAKYPDIKVECEYGAWTGWEEKQSLAIHHGAVERCAGNIAAVPRKADDRLARLVVIRLRRIRLRVIRKLPDRLNRLVKAVFIKITDKIHVMRTGIDPQRSAVICCKRIEIRALVITGQVKFLQKLPVQ